MRSHLTPYETTQERPRGSHESLVKLSNLIYHIQQTISLSLFSYSQSVLVMLFPKGNSLLYSWIVVGIFSLQFLDTSDIEEAKV